MANFYSSGYALQNLLIGLARGRQKEINRIERLKKHRLANHMVIPPDVKSEMDEWIESMLDSGLGEYFPGPEKRALARALNKMLKKFKEQKR